MNFVSPSNLLSVSNPISIVRESVEIFPESPLTRNDLARYRHLLNESVKTLASLTAIEYMATESRKRTPDEVDKDTKTYIAVKDCQVMTSEVFLPLVMADLHHLSAVYLDPWKELLQ